MADLIPYGKGGPGYVNSGGSRDGAEFIQDQLPRLQGLVLNAIAGARSRGLIGDEIADQIGIEHHKVRPRTSELRNTGRIVDSGRRRPGACGISMIVWVLPQYHPESGVSDGPC